MRYRRPRRRFIPLHRRPIRQEALRKLRVAHAMFERGEWQEAAEHFEQLARKADRRGLPQAGQYFLRAGYARIENNEMKTGLDLIKQGINIFVKSNQIHRINMMRPRLIAELQAKGRVDKDVNPAAVAGSLVAMLAAVASHQKGFQSWGVKQAELKPNLALLVHLGVTGRKPTK